MLVHLRDDFGRVLIWRAKVFLKSWRKISRRSTEAQAVTGLKAGRPARPTWSAKNCRRAQLYFIVGNKDFKWKIHNQLIYFFWKKTFLNRKPFLIGKLDIKDNGPNHLVYKAIIVIYTQSCDVLAVSFISTYSYTTTWYDRYS